MKKTLIILLHGVGSSGNDLNSLSEYWASQLPHCTIVTPDAPFSFMNSATQFQWFSIERITHENRAERVSKARPAFDEVIEKIFTQYNISLDDRVIFAGFSQGAIMALDALIRDRYHLTAVISFSGRLASLKPWVANKNKHTKILLIHGASDPIIPYYESVSAQNQLQRYYSHVEFFKEDNAPHTITPTAAQHALCFIQNML